MEQQAEGSQLTVSGEKRRRVRGEWPMGKGIKGIRVRGSGTNGNEDERKEGNRKQQPIEMGIEGGRLTEGS
jgi:hypothetical protein